MSLPNIDGLVSVMTTFNPKSPWLGHARQLANNIRASAATGIPPSMSNGDPAPTVVFRNNCSGGNFGHPTNKTPESNGTVQKGSVRFKMSDLDGYGEDHHTATENLEIETAAGSGRGSGTIANDTSALLRVEMESNLFGKGTLLHHAQARDDGADMFVDES